jgi:hypothetical protein
MGMVNAWWFHFMTMRSTLRLSGCRSRQLKVLISFTAIRAGLKVPG